MSSTSDPPISTVPSPNSSNPLPVSSSSSPNESIVLLNLPISTKLNRSNFLAWKSQILPLLHGHKLHKYLASPPPSANLTVNGQSQTNPAYDHWCQQDQLILAWLRSSLSETILGEVVSCSTTAELWTDLVQTFSSCSRARLLELRRLLQTTSKGTSSCTEFFKKMRSTADELSFIGSPVAEEDLVLYILGGLGSDFNALVTTVTARQGPISLSELQSLILTHEKLLQSQHSASSSSSLNSAAYFTQPRGPRPSYRPRGQRSGSNPRSGYRPANPPSRPSYGPPILPTPPHRPSSGPAQPNYNTSSSQPNHSTNTTNRPYNPDRDTICQLCSKKGHNAKNCWYIGDFVPNNSGQQNQPSYQSNFVQSAPPNAQAFATVPTQQSFDGSEWYLDSGATHHVTRDFNNLSSFMPYEGALHLEDNLPSQAT